MQQLLRERPQLRSQLTVGGQFDQRPASGMAAFCPLVSGTREPSSKAQGRMRCSILLPAAGFLPGRRTGKAERASNCNGAPHGESNQADRSRLAGLPLLQLQCGKDTRRLHCELDALAPTCCLKLQALAPMSAIPFCGSGFRCRGILTTVSHMAHVCMCASSQEQTLTS